MGKSTKLGMSTMPPEIKSNDFGGFLKLISRFEFEFCRCSCECAVACLCPRNSISNVVASLTIDDNIYIYICKMKIYM